MMGLQLGTPLMHCAYALFAIIHRISVFGVCDGHAGRNCAGYAAKHVHANAMAAGLVPVKVTDRMWHLHMQYVIGGVTEQPYRYNTHCMLLQCQRCALLVHRSRPARSRWT